MAGVNGNFHNCLLDVSSNDYTREDSAAQEVHLHLFVPWRTASASALRPSLLADAMKDARVRAKAITEGSGNTVGSGKNVRSGPFQVTAADFIVK
ncbi:MAG: hypothetical protein WCI25_04240 [Actinomycetes bacterium]